MPKVRLKPDATYGEAGRPDVTYGEPTLFASSIEEPRHHSGLSIWFAAAGSLVLGILIGFASGYRAGQYQAGEGTGAGQPFSESAVPEPLRVEPEPIVPSPDVQPDSVGRVPPTADLPAKRQVPAKADPPVVRQVPSPTGATGGGPAIPAGPGSLQVISRPAGAQVILDGRAVGRTPLSIGDVAAGEHSIRLELPGFNRWATTVDVKAGSPLRVTASLEQ